MLGSLGEPGKGISCPLSGHPHQGVQNRLNLPEKARNRAKERGTGYSPKRPEKLPIYIGVFRAFRSFRQKSKFRFGQHAL